MIFLLFLIIELFDVTILILWLFSMTALNIDINHLFYSFIYIINMKLYNKCLPFCLVFQWNQLVGINISKLNSYFKWINFPQSNFYFHPTLLLKVALIIIKMTWYLINAFDINLVLFSDWIFYQPKMKLII